MKTILIRISLITISLVLFVPNIIFAETRTFIKEYNYQASEEDSRNSSRTIALREVKRLLLEEVGTYLESITEVKGFKLTKDQITTMTAGIVKMELVNEQWDGHTYWLKAKIGVDTGNVVMSINALRKDREKIKELEEVRKRSDELLKENEKLKRELLEAKGQATQEQKDDHNRTINELAAIEWYEKGYAEDRAGNNQAAVDAYSKAIEINPKYAEAFINRGAIYGKLQNPNKAFEDFDKAIELNPKSDRAYHNRGTGYVKFGNYSRAIKDYDRAIELNPGDSGHYFHRGFSYQALGNYSKAFDDYDKAIVINPEYAAAFSSRGVAYGRLGNYSQAIKDLNRAIKLNPGDEWFYYNRATVNAIFGNYSEAVKDYDKSININPKYAAAYYDRALVYQRLRNTDQAVNDLKMAARLGDTDAMKLLRKKGIGW